MEHILGLIDQAQKGDEKAKEQIVEENVGLVWCVVRRFLNRGMEKEDLFQIGCVGLLKAIDKFDFSYDVKFSTYAVPVIAGEIKRFLRDDGMIKVSRNLKELAVKIARINAACVDEGKELPKVKELADALSVSPEEVVMAMEAGSEVQSLSGTIYQNEGSTIRLEDKLEDTGNRPEKVLTHILLEQLLTTLDVQDREIIWYRYFDNKTQSEVAKLMHTTQVQISRREKKILENLRKNCQ